MGDSPAAPAAPVGKIASFATKYFPGLIGFGIGYAAGDQLKLGAKLTKWMPGVSDPMLVGLTAAAIFAFVGFMIWRAIDHMIGALIGGLFVGMAVRVAFANLGVI